MSRSFIERVRQLNLPADQYIVVGSGLLDVLGIRLAEDIDVVVDSRLYESLCDGNPLVEEDTTQEAARLIYRGGEAEIWSGWPTEHGRVGLGELAVDAEVVDGVQFVSLDFIERWKLWFGRDKDMRDVELIQRYRGAR